MEIRGAVDEHRHVISVGVGPAAGMVPVDARVGVPALVRSQEPTIDGVDFDAVHAVRSFPRLAATNTFAASVPGRGGSTSHWQPRWRPSNRRDSAAPFCSSMWDDEAYGGSRRLPTRQSAELLEAEVRAVDRAIGHFYVEP